MGEELSGYRGGCHGSVSSPKEASVDTEPRLAVPWGDACHEEAEPSVAGVTQRLFVASMKNVNTWVSSFANLTR